ncbi:MAG TPA: outer membrane protein assembly factor BamA [Candidatus Binataceae bacterium]|nr:outer membrane protein assembly factor BamA [Candidatus Binataceae bacterium]
MTTFFPNASVRRLPARYASLVLLALLLAASRAFAQAPAPVISQIRIEGNQRVETDAIRIHISQTAGTPLDQTAVDKDVKAIYKMGFFDTVEVDKTPVNGGIVLTYKVKERPQITDVRLEGMKAIRTTDDKIVAATKIHPGAILDPGQVKDTINEITKIYQDKGFLDAKVNFRTILQPDNTAVAVFDVTEGPKVSITEIDFHGNKAFSSTMLRAVMETGTHSRLLSWVTNQGALDRQKLQSDVDHLTAFYYENGFLNVHVSSPNIKRVGNSLHIGIDIDEGIAYRVGRVAIAGNMKYPHREVAKLLTLKRGQRFKGSTLQHNVLTLSDFYSNRGYAFVNIDPRTQLDAITHRINVTFYINPGHEVLVNRINITGNTKTSDKVIRRELKIQEQEPYSAEAIRESKQALDRLGFFSETRITTEPAQQPDKINLDVNVAESNTSSLQVAGGYDTYMGIFGNFTLGNTNLFGGGESIVLNAQVGFLFQNYSISYTEPWFLDMPLSVGLELFDNQEFLMAFNQSAAGFAVNSYYPLTELGFKKIGPFSLKDVTAGLGYQFQSVGISGIQPLTTYNILRWQGYTRESELLPSLRRFTVDNPVDPRSGTVLSFNGQIGGIGGGEAFVKAILHGRYFYSFLKSPTWGTWVFSQGVTYGVGTALASGTGGELPLYERFFPGGVGGPADVRGYQLYSLGPLVNVYNQAGQPISVQDIGGSEMLILSNEITFPILSGLGLRGVVFSDAGQAYTLKQGVDPMLLQASAGMGIRWRSPFGPLSVDLAFPINPRPADQSTVFEIGAGAPL